MNRDPLYESQVGPITADKRERVIPASNLRRLRLALDGARENAHFVVPGDFLFADRDSTGSVYVRLNSTGEDAWPLTAQDGVWDCPMKEIFITHAAQAGKVLNLWYGYRARLLAGANSIASIGSILNAVTLATWRGINRTGSPGFWGAAGGTPVNNMHCQLFNPAASPVTLLLDRVIYDTGANADVWWYRHNAQIGGPGAAWQNKTIGAAAGNGLVSSLDQVGPSGTQVWYTSIPAGNSREVAFEEPVTIPPGQSVILRAGITTRLLVSFEGREV